MTSETNLNSNLRVIPQRGNPGAILRALAVAGLLAITLACSCRRESEKPAAAPSKPEEKPQLSLVFPEKLALDDPTVREFVSEAMRTCSAGAYDDFRLLWSAREEPLSRDDFDRSFRAVKTIRVRALEKALLAGEQPDAEPIVVYAMFAEIDLDPAQPIGERQSTREIVLMLVRENERWRFAQAPKPMREWVKEKATLPGPPPPPTQPTRRTP